MIGVHTPEFPFEKDVENVRRALKDMKVEYPIAIDNDFPMSKISEAFARLESGKARYRIVLDADF